MVGGPISGANDEQRMYKLQQCHERLLDKENDHVVKKATAQTLSSERVILLSEQRSPN